MSDERLQAAIEVLGTVSDPPIMDAFDAKTVSVPRNAWLSAMALACFYRADEASESEPEEDMQAKMDSVAKEWLETRAVIAIMFTDLGQSKQSAEHNAAAVIARLSHAGWTIERQEAS